MQWLTALLLSVDLLFVDNAYTPVYDYDIDDIDSATVTEVCNFM
jgi:hypothetical protein